MVTPKIAAKGGLAGGAPSDPLYAEQSQYRLIGDIEAVWRDYTGAGVAVALYDDGVQSGHWDLAANYDARLHPLIGGRRLAALNGSSDGHGTAAAGLIAAAANGAGGVGVAPGAALTGIDILSDASRADSFAGFLRALDSLTAFDVVNMSWNAASPSFGRIENPNLPGARAETVAAYALANAEGRGGLGTVIVQSAGNENLDANGSGLNATRHTVTVAAAGEDGYASDWGGPESGSNFGACVLVAAPGGGNGGASPLTTDITGRRGFSDGAATEFSGTSAAAPIVSGVIALMFEANPDLGWRDVKDILAASATLTGSGFRRNAGETEDAGWGFNGGAGWNNGAMHFSGDYGYGMVDVHAAARMAEVRGLFGPPQTSANERKVSLSAWPDAEIPDRGTARVAFDVGRNIAVEWIGVTLGVSHAWAGDLRVALIAPDGTRLEIGDLSALGSDAIWPGGRWTFGVEAFRGCFSEGTWTVAVSDVSRGIAGTLVSARIDFLGAAAGPDDVHRFTDAFMAMKALPGQGSRGRLIDRDGGVDWIDMAAVTADVTLDLSAGAMAQLDGEAAFRIARRAELEHAVTGDGDDLILGNGRGNALHGMRGDDRIAGARGSDQLSGGKGDDRMSGDAGADTLWGGAGDDALRGGAGKDRLAGGAGADVFRFLAAAEAGLGRDRDVIADFQPGRDTINLRAIDADPSAPGDDAFAFRGRGAFSGDAGELRVQGRVLSGDLDGDRSADFQIWIGQSGGVTASDFIL